MMKIMIILYRTNIWTVKKWMLVTSLPTQVKYPENFLNLNSKNQQKITQHHNLPKNRQKIPLKKEKNKQ